MAAFFHRFVTRIATRLVMSACVLATAVLAGCCSQGCALSSASAGSVVPVSESAVQGVRGGAYAAAQGDVLKITVYGEDDLSGDYTVGPDGAVALPLVGAVKVAGQGLEALPEIIATAYRGDYLKDPKVSVEVKGRLH